MDAKTIKTPDTLPWIPPGKPKDESFNKFVHKKGSIASRINAEVIHQENNPFSFKRNICSCRRLPQRRLHWHPLYGTYRRRFWAKCPLHQTQVLLLIPFKDSKGGVFSIWNSTDHFFPRSRKCRGADLRGQGEPARENPADLWGGRECWGFHKYSVIQRDCGL